MPAPTHIVIVGGGFVGVGVARRLERRLRRGEARLTLVSPQPTMTYQPLLAEVAAGSIEPRHVVVPLRRLLRRTRVLGGMVADVDPWARSATVVTAGGEVTTLAYDELVLAAGSVSRRAPGGLAGRTMSFQSLPEAVALRDHVLSRLDVAAATEDKARRRSALTFVIVGGGYTGVEVLAELQDLARTVVRRHYPELREPLRWVLVEDADRIMPEIGLRLAHHTAQHLRDRGVEVRLRTRVASVTDDQVALSDGTRIDAQTLVWTAGIDPEPLAARSGLPVDAGGRVRCDPMLRVLDLPGVWTAGDNAAVPDLSRTDGASCSASAQHAVRQARRLADNLLASLRGRALRPYRHRDAGSVASLGLHKGVAQIYGLRLRGLPAWLLHRVYHLAMLPTVDRKVRVAGDWLLALLLRRETTSMRGLLDDPRVGGGLGAPADMEPTGATSLRRAS